MDLILDSSNIEKKIDYFWENIEKLRDFNHFLSPIYTKSFFEYQREYCKSNGTYIDEEYFMVLNNDEEILCAYIFFKTKENNNKSFELNFGNELPGLLILNKFIDKKTLSNFKDKFFGLKNSANKIRFTIPQTTLLNKAYLDILNNINFNHQVKWSRFINLKETKDLMWRDLRKSYKSCINKGLREQEILIMDEKKYDKSIFRNIKALHQKVSGRITRSKLTWDLQFEAIKEGKGFSVCSYDNKNLLAAIFFIKTKVNAYYSVGIYTEEAKEKNFGHSLIWQAIIYCKEKGLKLCEIDMNINFMGLEQIDDKLKKISHFKSGFGGEIFNRHEFIF
mgnify:CR=1 FL=1